MHMPVFNVIQQQALNRVRYISAYVNQRDLHHRFRSVIFPPFTSLVIDIFALGLAGVAGDNWALLEVA